VLGVVAGAVHLTQEKKIITRKPASFADGMVETTMEEVINVESKIVIWTQCKVFDL